MKTEMEIIVHRVTVRRLLNGNMEIVVNPNDSEAQRVLHITPEESENLEQAISMINLIAASVDGQREPTKVKGKAPGALSQPDAGNA